MPDTRLPEILEDLSLGSDAAKLLHDYFTAEIRAGVPHFSGARFELLSPSWRDKTQAFEITPEDIVATQCLGVEFKGRQIIELLEEKRVRITELLKDSRISPNAQLWDDNQEDVEAQDSPANQLWRLLKRPKNNGIGATKASKLMARKRPNLFPVYDKWVKAALGRKNADGFWKTYRELVLIDIDGKPLHEHLQQLVDELSLPREVTPLRACDVILWYSTNPRLENRRELIRKGI